MHKLIAVMLISLCVSIFSVADETKHIFIAVDNGNNRLYYVDQFEPDKNWTVNTDTKPRDIRLADDRKSILISVDTGAVEYDLVTGKRTG